MVFLRWLVPILFIFVLVPASPTPAAQGASCHVDLPGTGLFAVDFTSVGGPTVGGCRVEFPRESFLAASPAEGCDVTPDGVRKSTDGFDFVFFQCQTGVYNVVNTISYS